MSFTKEEEEKELYKELGDHIEDLEKHLERLKKAREELELELMKSSFYKLFNRINYMKKEYDGLWGRG